MAARTAGLVCVLGLLGASPSSTHAQHAGHHAHGYRGALISPGLLGVGAGYGTYLTPAIVTVPPILVPAWRPVPIGFAPPLVFDRGQLLAGPMPNPALAGLSVRPPAAAGRRPDAARSTHLVTLGDRLFRAGNTRRAEERYEQAMRADPGSAVPHLRLAQLALVRGQYTEGANQLREAQTAQPGWLIQAPDVQALFAEPTDFARHVARLESHLQAEPGDRDAWLLLGAEWFLSGRARKAADVFLRLADRKPDPALAAFLDATTPRAD